MFDFGIQELLLIFIVALLVFGPKRLPEIARAIGKGIAEMKRSLDNVKTEIDTEMQEVKELKDMSDPLALKNEIFKNESLIKPYEEPTAPGDKKKAGLSATGKTGNVNRRAKPAQKKAAVNKRKKVRPAAARPKQGRKVKS
jgi:Tat protein translocase TatB subunit